MFHQLLQILFGQDHRFLTLRTEGLPPAVRSALATFWSDPEYEGLSCRAQLAAQEWSGLVDVLEGLAKGRITGDPPALWHQAAQASPELAKVEPVAGVLVSLQAMAAWVGGLGDRLYFQPWEGHHPGWHVFPLIASRNLVAADAVWSALFLTRAASEFIASAKDAPFDPRLRGTIAEYEAVHAAAERVRNDSVDELAWALHASLGTSGESFRAELAALSWTAGDLLHADLLGPEGPREYVPSYAFVRALVDHSLRTLHQEPLAQYVWLEMKDRGPVPLREHHTLFSRINNVFHGSPLHELDAVAGLSRAYAKALIGLMRGRVQDADRERLFEAASMLSSLLEERAPDAYVRIASLATLLDPPPAGQAEERWSGLADMSAQVLRWADRIGRYEPFDRVLEAPFHHLRVDSAEALEQSLERIEACRGANLGYWLAISPPLRRQQGVPDDLLEEERVLLRELRGARFIRLLPHLPMHYRRFGFNMDDAVAGPPPGVTPEKDRGLLGFDPFDQATGARILQETRDRLLELYERMREASPSYAAARIDPPSSAADFVAALGAHRGG